MIKRYCDWCGKDAVPSLRIFGMYKGMHVSAEMARSKYVHQGQEPAEDLCAECIIAAVRSLEEK